MNAPHWWTATHQQSWDTLKGAVVDEWSKVAGAAGKLEKSVAEHALKFGHGAKDVYKSAGVWSKDVEAKLKADWEKTHQDATNGWDKVRDAVKHGFEKSNKA